MYFTPWTTYDPDATAWMRAVEVQDGEELELGVRVAMNQLVLDLKSNSLWTPIKTMTVRCGARTLAGALIDIKTPSASWTNTNFVGSDYNRALGLSGNGTTKYLNTNRACDADPQNNQAAWTVVTSIASGVNDRYLGAGLTNGRTQIHRVSSTDIGVRCRFGTASTIVNGGATGLMGVSRSASGSYNARANGADNTITQTSNTAETETIFDYAGNEAGVATNISNHRAIATVIGEAHSLSAAETCITTYYNSITALGL